MKKIILFSLIFSCATLFSQNRLSLNDSLIGFDEQSVINSAAYKGITPEEMPVYIAINKREFIRQKYNLKLAPVLSNNVDMSKIATSYCLNEDFENSSTSTPWTVPSTNSITTSNGINGWFADYGSSSSGGNTASCTLTFCCTGNPTDIQIISPSSTGHIDPIVGSSYPIFSLFGDSLNNGAPTYSINARGDFFAKVNGSAPGARVQRITKTINVTNSNSMYQFAYMAVVQGAHCCCDNGGVTIRFRDCLNNPLTLPTFSVTPPAALSCTPTGSCISSGNPITLITSTASAGWYWSKWTISSVDLSPWIGGCVKAEIIAYGCPYSGHGAYAYFDSQCDTMCLLNNTTRFMVTAPSTTLNGCAGVTNTISAPMGFSPYSWQGPPGFTASTSSVITTNIPGTYTLTMGAFGPYSGTTKYITLNHGSIPITTSTSNSVLCVGDSAQITASGVGSYTWSTGATTPSIYVKPSVTTTYTVNVNYQGCPGMAMITQSVAVCTGLNNPFRSPGSISVYPNPNKGDFDLKIGIEVKNAEFELRNILGQVVLKQSVKQGTNAIKTENLAKGIYNYSVINNKEIISVGKVVIE